MFPEEDVEKHVEVASNGNGLHPKSDGLPPTSNGLHPTSARKRWVGSLEAWTTGVLLKKSISASKGEPLQGSPKRVTATEESDSPTWRKTEEEMLPLGI